MAQMVKNLPSVQERPGFDPWVGKIPWRREWQPTPALLPGEFPWTKDPGRLQPMGHKDSDTTEQLITHTQKKFQVNFLADPICI